MIDISIHEMKALGITSIQVIREKSFDPKYCVKHLEYEKIFESEDDMNEYLNSELDKYRRGLRNKKINDIIK